MAYGEYSNITVGINVDDSGVKKAFWPGSYDVDITQKVKQVVLKPDTKNAVFFSDYTQHIRQEVTQGSSFRNAVWLADHTATTHMELDAGRYRTELMRLPMLSNNSYDVSLALKVHGEQQVSSAYNLLASLPREFFVYGDFKGETVRKGLMGLVRDSTTLEQVLTGLEQKFLQGNIAAGKFGNVLRDAMNVSSSVMNATLALNRINALNGGNFKGQSLANYKALQDFVLRQGPAAAASSDIAVQRAWIEEYNGTHRNLIKTLTVEAKQSSKSAEQTIRDANAVEKVLNNVKRAIDDIVLKAREFKTPIPDSLKELKRSFREISEARTTKQYSQILQNEKNNVYANQMRDAYRDLKLGVRGIMRGERDEISKANYDARLQALTDRAAGLRKVVDGLTGRGVDISGLRKSLDEVDRTIAEIGTRTGAADRINGISDAVSRMNRIQQEARSKGSEAREYQKEIEKENREFQRRKRELESLDEKLSTAYNNVTRKFGARGDMEALLSLGRSTIDSGKLNVSSDSAYTTTKREIEEIIGLLNEELRKEQQIEEQRRKAAKASEENRKNLRNAEKIAASNEGVLLSTKGLSEQNTEARKLHDTITQLNRDLKETARTGGRNSEGKTFAQLTAISRNKISDLTALKSAYKQLGTQIKYAEDQVRSITTMQAKGINSPVLEGIKKQAEDLVASLRQVQQTGNTATLTEQRSKAMAELDRIRSDKDVERTRWYQARNAAMDDGNEKARLYLENLDRMAAKHKTNTGLVSQLGQEIAMAYSIYTIRNFLKSIIEIGGQFEYQRAAISNILDDTGKANALFGQIKNMALKSPFNTIQLDQYAKELSAFNVQYNELFPKLKKLADISAGVGVDMSRIILAYGHVQATGYLEGMQRRQFSNANINVLTPLAKMYREQEGVPVSEKDVLKRISEKRVTAEDLDRVLMAMAEPGGQFYNMQEAMADTVKGTFKNLEDAVNHMYMDIETKFAAPLKIVGQTLTSLTTVVSKYSGVLLRLGTTYALLKAYQSASIKLSKGEVSARIDAAKAANMQRRNDLLYAKNVRKRSLSTAEKEELAHLDQIGKKELSLIMTNKALSDSQQRSAVTTAYITQGERELIASGESLDGISMKRLRTLELITKEEYDLIAAGKLEQSQVDSLVRSRMKAVKMDMEAIAAMEIKTKDEIINAAATGRLSREELKLAFALGIVTEKEVESVTWAQRTVASMGAMKGSATIVGAAFARIGKSLLAIVKSPWTALKFLGNFFVNFKATSTAAASGFAVFSDTVRFGLRTIKASIKSLMASLGPMILSFAAFEAVFKAIDWVKGYGKDSEELKSVNDESIESFRALNDVIREVDASIESTGKSFADLSPDQLRENIEKMRGALKDNIAYADDFMKQVFATNADGNGNETYILTLAEQAELLRKKLEDSAKVKELLANGGNANMEASFESNDPWWGNTAGEVDDFSKSLSKLITTERAAARYSKMLDKTIGEIAKNGSFRTLFKGLDSYEDKLRAIAENAKAFEEFKSIISGEKEGAPDNDYAWGALEEYRDAVAEYHKEYKDLYETVSGAADDFIEKQKLSEKSIKAQGAAAQDTQILLQGMYRYMTTYLGKSEETVNTFLKKFMKEKYGIEIGINIPKDKAIEGWKRAILDKLEGGTRFEAVIKAAPDLISARDSAIALYKEAKEKANKLGKLQFGADFKLQLGSKDSIKSAIDSYRNQRSRIREQINGSGGSLHVGAGNMMVPSKRLTDKERSRLEMQEEALNQLILYLETIYEGFAEFQKEEEAKAGFEKTRKNGSGKSDTTDLARQKWDKENNAIKEYISAYESMIREFGEDVANLKISTEDIYRKLSEDVKDIQDFDITKADDLDYIISFLKKRYEAGTPSDPHQNEKANAEQRKASSAAFAKYITDVDIRNIERKVQKALTVAENEIEKRRNRISLFKTIFDATGSEELARQFAEFDGYTFDFKGFEAYNSYLQGIEEFNRKMEAVRFQYRGGGDEQTPVAYTFDQLSEMTEEELAKLPETIREKFYEARRETDKGLTDQLQLFSELANSYKTRQEELKVEEKRIQQDTDRIDFLIDKGVISRSAGYQYINRMKAKHALDTVKSGSEYATYASYSLPFYSKAADDFLTKFRRRLKSAFNAGIISASEFEDQMKSVEQTQFRNNANRSWADRLSNAVRTSRAFSFSGYYDSRLEKAYFDRKSARAQNDQEGVAAADELIEKLQKKRAVYDNFNQFAESFNTLSNNVKGALGSVRAFFDAIGDEETADKIGVAQDGLTAIQNVFEGFRTGGWIGGVIAAVGSTFDMIVSIFQHSDREKTREINRQNRELSQQKRTYSDIQNSMEHSYRYLTGKTEMYAHQNKSLMEQLALVKSMKQLEMEKHKTDLDAIESYNDQIVELENQIADIRDTMASEIYGIDFNGWADTLTNALKEAFDNGKDAALAWESSVGDIMRGVASNMIKTMYVEPALQKIYDTYLGTNGRLMDEHTGVLKEDQRELENELTNMGDDIRAFMSSSLMNGAEGIYDMIEELFPASGTDTTTGGLSKIGESMTEETASLTASYINAIRSDVSASRSIANQQLDTLNSINGHLVSIELAVTGAENCLRNAINGVSRIHVQ